MDHKLIYCLALLIAPIAVQCISVVGPKVLRPFGPYRVAIAGGSRAYTLYVAVEGRRANGEEFSQGREVQVQPATSRLIDLEIQDPGFGHYELVARSTAGPQFSSSSPLMYQPRSFCIFVQTDKRIYQPGDTIKFRVVALDKYLLPLPGVVDVSVLDARGSAVQQWAAVPLDRGIFSEQMLLADELALGQWTIQVETRGQKYSRHIMIADYVMPKYQMDIKIPKEMLFSEGRFNINITAKHYNGLPVRGELTISAYAVFFSGVLQPVFASPSRKVVEIDGSVEVTYDLKTDLDLAEDAARPLVIEAVLEEKDTLIRQNISSRILLLRTPYRLKVTAPNYFKPMLPYTVQVEVVDPSGQIMNINEEVTVERLWDDGSKPNTTTVTLKQGLATYSLVPDTAHQNSTLNLVVKYKEVAERVINVQASAASGGQYLTIEVLTRGTGVGDELRARITASEAMDLIHYAVVGRGDILLAKTLELSPARRSVDISVPVSAAMAPGCTVVAWYSRIDAVDNSILSAAVYAPQREFLQHKVSVSAMSSITGVYGPNALVDIKVNGEPGAHVALLGEDQNTVVTCLAGSDGLGYGIDMHTVEREVESFSGLKHSVFKNEEHLPGMGLDLGGYTATDVFHNTGLVILTDGVVTASAFSEDPSRQVPETGTRPPLAGPYAFSRLPPPPSPRYYLTVTPQGSWMTTNLTLDYDGKGTSDGRTPSTTGELIVAGFAVHPTLGLGLAPPHRFTTSVPLSITAELPETMQKGEALAVVVTLKSSLSVDTSVEVTFHNSDQYFEFEPLENTIDSMKKIELFHRLRVTVPAKGSASTAFLVSLVRTGLAPVIVEASGNGVSASFFRTIHVRDGYEDEIWAWELLDARRGVARANVTLEPVAGTKLGPVSLLATGDLLAIALQAIRDSNEPAADPPHALKPMAVAAIILDYFQATQQDEGAIIKAARAKASSGFQRLMAYRLPDGSFAEDTSDESQGDVWMTSIALRWLARSARYVEVSPVASTAAAKWLVDQQKPDGGWPLPPKKNDPKAQRAICIAAYAILALMQHKGSEYLYKNAINKALDYVAKGLSPSLDAYSLAVVASTLAANSHPQAPQALEMMSKYANYTGSAVFWSRTLSGSEWRNPWLKGNNVETITAAFGVNAMIASRLVDEATPTIRYLLQNFRPDSVEPDVLDAIAEYAKATKTTNKLRLSVNVTGFEEPRQFSIGEDNSLILQTQLVRNTRSAFTVTEGRGVAVVGLSSSGSTNVTGAWPRFTLDPRVDQVSTRDRLQLSICVGYVPQGNETESGLALLTVHLPSGYLADIHTITELTSLRAIVSARLGHGGATVYAWLRPRRAEQCVTLAAPHALPAARQRAGAATIMALYDSSHRARVFFRPITSTACDACRAWASCDRACGAAERQRAEDAGARGGEGTSATNGRTGKSANSATVAMMTSLIYVVFVLLLL